MSKKYFTLPGDTCGTCTKVALLLMQPVANCEQGTLSLAWVYDGNAATAHLQIFDGENWVDAELETINLSGEQVLLPIAGSIDVDVRLITNLGETSNTRHIQFDCQEYEPSIALDAASYDCGDQEANISFTISGLPEGYERPVTINIDATDYNIGNYTNGSFNYSVDVALADGSHNVFVTVEGKSNNTSSFQVDCLYIMLNSLIYNCDGTYTVTYTVSGITDGSNMTVSIDNSGETEVLREGVVSGTYTDTFSYIPFANGTHVATLFIRDSDTDEIVVTSGGVDFEIDCP